MRLQMPDEFTVGNDTDDEPVLRMPRGRDSVIAFAADSKFHSAASSSSSMPKFELPNAASPASELPHPPVDEPQAGTLCPERASSAPEPAHRAHRKSTYELDAEEGVVYTGFIGGILNNLVAEESKKTAPALAKRGSLYEPKPRASVVDDPRAQSSVPPRSARPRASKPTARVDLHRRLRLW